MKIFALENIYRALADFETVFQKSTISCLNEAMIICSLKMGDSLQRDCRLLNLHVQIPPNC